MKPARQTHLAGRFLGDDNGRAARVQRKRAARFHGSSLPIRPGSAISPNFIARLIKGCRGDVPDGCFVYGITSNFNALTSI
jgi:hypothetical protein